MHFVGEMATKVPAMVRDGVISTPVHMHSEAEFINTAHGLVE